MVISDPVMLTDASRSEDIVMAVHIDPRAANFAERGIPPLSRKR